MSGGLTLALPRRVAPEALDDLPPEDPRARGARRDLLRVHRAMGTRGILVRALRALRLEAPRERPLRVVELGCGDGRLLLRVARALGWGPVALTLLDRQAAVDASTLEAYRALGWDARLEVADVFAWAGAPIDATARADLIVTSLFLHHFEPPSLATLLALVAARTRAFVAYEPRRSRLALAGSHLVGALGANAVTRADAVISVRAGFRGDELTMLWPHTGGWSIEERGAGPFGHLLSAVWAGEDP
ncbi:MAG TPA: methyltransferase domain-containing protein [Caldimonas sp.]|nr:methyltransferase domain-containing protein [Caldimonas sp.]